MSTFTDTPLGPYLSAEIRAEIARQGTTITVVANKAGMDRKTLGQSLRGNRILDVLEVEQVARALDLTGSELYALAESRRESGRAVA